MLQHGHGSLYRTLSPRTQLVGGGARVKGGMEAYLQYSTTKPNTTIKPRSVVRTRSRPITHAHLPLISHILQHRKGKDTDQAISY